jgi:hypothetical protein
MLKKDSVRGKTKKYGRFYVRKSVVDNVLYANKPTQNSVSISLLKDYKDVLPINGVPIINSMMNSFEEMRNDEN